MQYYTNNNNTGLKMGGGASINKNSSMNYFGNGSFKTTTSPIQGNRLNQSSGIGGGMVQGAVTGIAEGTSSDSGSSSSGSSQKYIRMHGGRYSRFDNPPQFGFTHEETPTWYIDDDGNTHIYEDIGGGMHWEHVRPATDEEKEIDGWYPDDDEDFGDSEDDGVLPNPGKPGKGAEAPKGDDDSEDDETLPNPGKSGKGAEEPKDDEDAVTVSNRKTSSRSSGQSVGHNIVLKHEELESRRNDLSSAANEIGKLWNDIKGKEMVKVSSVWDGADGQAYVNKINAFDPKLKASIEALQLLSNAYEKADNQLQQTQSEVTKDINLL